MRGYDLPVELGLSKAGLSRIESINRFPLMEYYTRCIITGFAGVVIHVQLPLEVIKMRE